MEGFHCQKRICICICASCCQSGPVGLGELRHAGSSEGWDKRDHSSLSDGCLHLTIQFLFCFLQVKIKKEPGIVPDEEITIGLSVSLCSSPQFTVMVSGKNNFF